MQSMDRSKLLGASEVPTLFNANPFCTPLKLWSLKRGLVEPDDETEPQYWGKAKEAIIANRFARDHKVKLMAYKERFKHPSMSYFSCELDRIIVGTRTNVECKAVHEYKAKDWAGGVNEMPAYVILQTQAQMGLSKRKETWAACLIGSSKYVEKLVKFDEELYADIEKRVKDFWENYVLANVPPMASADDDDVLLALYPKSNEEIQTVESLNDSIRLLKETQGHIAELENQEAEIKNRLKAVIGENMGVKTSEYVVSWKPQVSRRVDVDFLKKNYEHIWKQCLKDSAIRVLRVAANKEKK